MKQVIDALGQLHDAEVAKIEIDPTGGNLVVVLHDIFANFQNYSVYPGEITGSITFTGLSGFDMSLEIPEQLTIDGVEVDDPVADGYPFKIALSPGGYLSGHAKQILLHPATEIAKVANWNPGDE